MTTDETLADQDIATNDVKTMSFVTKMIGHQRTMATGLVEVAKGMEMMAAGYEALQLDAAQIRAEAFHAGREAAARDIEEFAAKRKAAAEQHPPETAFAHMSNRNVLTAYGTAAEVARGVTR